MARAPIRQESAQPRRAPRRSRSQVGRTAILRQAWNPIARPPARPSRDWSRAEASSKHWPRTGAINAASNPTSLSTSASAKRSPRRRPRPASALEGDRAMPTQTQHDQAIQQLIANPADSATAHRLLQLAREDPAGAQAAHGRVKPPPPAIPLDVQQLPFRRHNLMMPFSPKQIAMPRTLEELVAIVQAAAVAWEPIKSIGDGYGFANTGFTKGCLIPTVDGLNRILTVDREVLKAGVDADHLCKFESGATVELIGAHLWGLGKAVLNQPGYEKLTYVGTMSSGGHGSGTWCGPLSEHARALHLVTLDENGKAVQFQVELSNGISDPAKFAEKHPTLELIQNDDMFRACTVAIGGLGIIYSATIEVRDAYNINENRTKFPWAAVKARLPQLLADQGPRKRLLSIEVW